MWVIAGLLAGGALFLVALAVLASVGSGRRLGRFQRRHAYETECLIKSIQQIERQQQQQNRRIEVLASLFEKIQNERKRVPDENQAALAPSAPRILH